MKTGPLPFGLNISIISRAFRKKMDEKACAMGLTAVQLRVRRPRISGGANSARVRGTRHVAPTAHQG